MQLITEEKEVCVPRGAWASRTNEINLPLVDETECVTARWTMRKCERGTYGCIGHQVKQKPSPHHLAYGILQDFLISEDECNSVDFEIIYGCMTLEQLLTEIRTRLEFKQIGEQI